MTVGAPGASGAEAGTTVVAWPEIEVRVRCGRLVPQWTASSDHPEAGVVHGRGISRAGAVRSLLRDLRRTREWPSDASDSVSANDPQGRASLTDLALSSTPSTPHVDPTTQHDPGRCTT